MKIDFLMEVISDISDEITEQLMNQHGDEYIDIVPLILTSSSYVTSVEFFGIEIWNSENDERDYVEVDGEEIYENLETYLRKQIDRYLRVIGKLKLIEE